MESKNQTQQLDENELIKVRHEKLNAFIEKGVAPFGHRYEVTHHAADIRAEYGNIAEEEEGGEVQIAGRVMAIRGHGKASFGVLADRSGNIQIYFKLDTLGEEKYSWRHYRLARKSF